MREQAERELRAEMEEASSRERRLEEEVQRRKQLQAETEEDFNKERLNYQGQLAHLQDSLHTLHREAEDERHISEEEAAQREQLEQECLAIRLSLTRLEQAEETLQADNRQLHALNQQLQQTLAELEAHLASEMQLWLTEKNALEDDLRSAEVQLQSDASRFEELQKEQTATYHH